MPNTHILSNFQEALRSLRNDALMMASLTERNLETPGRDCSTAMRIGNTAIADDEEVDTLRFRLTAKVSTSCCASTR